MLEKAKEDFHRLLQTWVCTPIIETESFLSSLVPIYLFYTAIFVIRIPKYYIGCVNIQFLVKPNRTESVHLNMSAMLEGRLNCGFEKVTNCRSVVHSINKPRLENFKNICKIGLISIFLRFFFFLKIWTFERLVKKKEKYYFSKHCPSEVEVVVEGCLDRKLLCRV